MNADPYAAYRMRSHAKPVDLWSETIPSLLMAGIVLSSLAVGAVVVGYDLLMGLWGWLIAG